MVDIGDVVGMETLEKFTGVIEEIGGMA